MAKNDDMGPVEALGWGFRILATVLSAKFMLASLKSMEERREAQRKQQARKQNRTYTLEPEGQGQQPPEELSYRDLV